MVAVLWVTLTRKLGRSICEGNYYASKQGLNCTVYKTILAVQSMDVCMSLDVMSMDGCMY